MPERFLGEYGYNVRKSVRQYIGNALAIAGIVLSGCVAFDVLASNTNESVQSIHAPTGMGGPNNIRTAAHFEPAGNTATPIETSGLELLIGLGGIGFTYVGLRMAESDADRTERLASRFRNQLDKLSVVEDELYVGNQIVVTDYVEE